MRSRDTIDSSVFVELETQTRRSSRLDTVTDALNSSDSQNSVSSLFLLSPTQIRPSLYRGLSFQQISGTLQKRGRRETEDAETQACLGEFSMLCCSCSIQSFFTMCHSVPSDSNRTFRCPTCFSIAAADVMPPKSLLASISRPSKMNSGPVTAQCQIICRIHSDLVKRCELTDSLARLQMMKLTNRMSEIWPQRMRNSGMTYWYCLKLDQPDYECFS